MAVFLGGISGVKEFNYERAYNKAPKDIKIILDRLGEFPEYDELKEAAKKLKSKGYYMNYGLDGGITELRKIK
jgi:hypothetical protein